MKFSILKKCDLFAVVFIWLSLFLFCFCSHLQNIIFLQSLKMKDIFFIRFYFLKQPKFNTNDCIAVSKLNYLTIYLLSFYQIESANYKKKMFHSI